MTEPGSGRTCPSCASPLPIEALYCGACGAATPTAISAEGGYVSASGLALNDAAYQRRVQAAMGSAFEIVRLLGRGGFASVFAARDLKLKRDVAVKVLRPELLGSSSMLSRFQQEAEIIARLRHPHVVPVYQVGEGGGLIWFVMPLVAGESLRTSLESNRRFSFDEVRRILVEAATGLAAAHEAGVVHRDIKPENIMLEGPEARVLVMDFGIARSLEVRLEAGATATGTVIGTPQYMSPEQAAGERTIDHRSDIYSLGVVGYEMLAGRPPFHGDSFRDIMTRQLLTEPDELGRIAPQTPHDLAAAVMRCLRKDPAERWASLREMADSLRTGALVERADERTGFIGRTGGRGRRATRWVVGATVAGIASGLGFLVLKAPWSGPPPGSGTFSRAAADTASGPAGVAATDSQRVPMGSRLGGPTVEQPHDLAASHGLAADTATRPAGATGVNSGQASVDATPGGVVTPEAVPACVAGATAPGNQGVPVGTERDRDFGGDSILRQLEFAIRRRPVEAESLLLDLYWTHPTDSRLRFEAAALFADSRRYEDRNVGFEAFARLLRGDPSYRDSVLPFVRRDLQTRRLAMRNLDLIRERYYEQLRPELEAGVSSDNDTVRQNAYIALREADLARQDLMAFHRRNLLRTPCYAVSQYADRVQLPIEWARQYFRRLTDEAQLRQAIALLLGLRATAELERAHRLIDNAVAELQSRVASRP